MHCLHALRGIHAWKLRIRNEGIWRNLGFMIVTALKRIHGYLPAHSNPHRASMTEPNKKLAFLRPAHATRQPSPTNKKGILAMKKGASNHSLSEPCPLATANSHHETTCYPSIQHNQAPIHSSSRLTSTLPLALSLHLPKTSSPPL